MSLSTPRILNNGAWQGPGDRCRSRGWAPRFAICTSAVIGLGLPCGAAPPEGGASAGPPVGEADRVVREGIAVEFAIFPAGGSAPGALVAGEMATVQFRITDTATGTPLTTLEPAAWMHPVLEGAMVEPLDCTTMVSSFLTGSLSARAEIDMTAFYVLALNDNATISVVDPLFSYGGSRLLALVLLESEGEDWVLSADESRLYVTMPDVGQVAVVDTATWKVTANIDAGRNPRRLVLQPDGRYLWVGIDGDGPGDPRSGVAVVDTTALETVTVIPTGAGHHEITITGDSRYVFVTNRDGDTLSVIDVWTLEKVADLPTGRRPVSVAFSPLSRAVYAVSEQDGTILVVDGQGHEILETIEAEPGLGALRFAPGGRLGFVVNGRENVVHILDAATQRIVQTGDVGEHPDQVAFTENLAYVRSLGTDIVLMIPLDEVGREGAPVPIIDFTGGHAPFGAYDRLSPADGIVPAPGGTSVLVANPVDEAIYYYREGMAAPMGHFRNYGRKPRAVMVADRSLREVEPGVYSTDVKLTRSGLFDVPFFLDSPRIVHCFSARVAPSPEAPPDDGPRMRVEPLTEGRTLRAGEDNVLRLRVTDPETGAPRADLVDFGVLAFNTAGWQQRQWARSLGEGLYEAAFTPPTPGVYYVFFQCPSLNVRLNELPPLILKVAAAPGPAALSEASG